MNKKGTRNLSYLLIMVMLATMLTGCSVDKSKAVDNSKQTAAKNMLNVAVIGEPKTLDCLMASDIMLSSSVFHQIYNYLIDYRSDGTLVPGLAESWDYSKDGTEITFHLKKGIKFHNGETMTAEDVAFSLNTAIKSKFTQNVTSVMDSAKVIDENTVVLKLKHPFGPIEYCIGSSYMGIVNKKAYEADPDGYGRHPIGTGPYEFVEWKSGDKITLKAFDNYYKGPANIKDITFKIITDSSTAVVALEKGEIDLMFTPPKTDRNNLINNPNIKYYETESTVNMFIAFNNKDGLFVDKRLRQAIAYAIDKKSMVLGAVEGIGTPIDTPMNISSIGWPEDFKNREYDVEKAKKLLTEAGYPNGFTVTLKTTESPTYYKPTEVLQDQLKQIGITANIEKMERGAYFDDIITKRDYEITVMGVVAVYPDSDQVYQTYHSKMIKEGRNFINSNNQKLDELLDKGRLSNNKEEREKIYREICELWKEECFTVPLYTYMTAIAANKDLKGLIANPSNRLFLYDLHWEN